ncbi:Cadmium efflux system accessory protein [Stenotrophomonas maltophilia SKK35]|nr:Cadmium efflux system accessory protein [Stenotrophomonas maltophilia SKK35]
MDRHPRTLHAETGRRLLHRPVHPRRLERTRRIHLPLQHQVGGVPAQPQGPAGNRHGPTQPARRQDRQLELKTPRMNADKVFKALADPTRRTLLDLLCEDNGQTLGQLCEHLDMARQSVTQHLGLLEDANLISTVRRGREKLHFINPVPLHEVYERWVRKFEQQRLGLLHDLKRELEGE